MTRRRVLLAACLCGLVTGVGVLVGPGRDGLPGPDLVPVFRVRREPFVRTAVAEGFLRAERSTPLTAALDLSGSQRIAWLAPDGTPIHKGDLVARLDPTALELTMADADADFEIARRKLAESRARNAAAREGQGLETSLARRELQQSEEFAPRDPAAYSRHDIIESEIDQELAGARLSIALNQNDLVARLERTEGELLRIDLAKAESADGKAKRGLAALEIRAPHDGLLLLAENNYGQKLRAGEEVWPGGRLAEIPDPTRMQVQAYVLEADAGGLQQGCRARVILEARPEKAHGGRVRSVDALAKQRVWNVPVQYFETTVELDGTDSEAMKIGQRVTVEIVLQEVAGALAVPPEALFDQDGRTVVYRREGARWVPAVVKPGGRGLSRVLIEDGLEEGADVALRDPRSGPARPPGPPAAPAGGAPAAGGSP